MPENDLFTKDGTKVRYIGSKTNMLHHLENVFATHTRPGGLLLDVFGGTGVVGKNFKNRYTTYSNDFLHFAYLLLFAQIELNGIPSFRELSRELGAHPIDYLNKLRESKEIPSRSPLIFTEFSPGGPHGRMYFREATALHIDLVCQSIENWRQTSLIDDAEAKYLLACLIMAVPSVSNIAGTYGAFLKSWDKRTENPLQLDFIPVLDNKRVNRAFNSNALDVVASLSGDVLYVDPPYNARQYNANYHVLETIATYDYPQLFGKTGLRREPNKSSDFCKSKRVAGAFAELLSNADFEVIIISYSTEGLLSEEELVSVAASARAKSRVSIYRFPYRRYSRLRSQTDECRKLEELVVVLKQ